MTQTSPPPSNARTIFLIAGEESGDQLGAGLMASLRQKTGGTVRFVGVGGVAMQREGLVSLFPISDISLMGFATVLGSLPKLWARIRQTVRAIDEARPDALVIIDTPDFTHRVAKRARRRHPTLPIVNYVSPSVWAWRPWRARNMRGYVDHVLALLPFEPAAYERLQGPPCTYVGHRLVEEVAALRPSEAERAERDASAPIVAILPGSRRSEIERLLPIFLEAAERLAGERPELRFVLPTLPGFLDVVGARVAANKAPVRVVIGVAERHAALRSARAAIAASGTITLELALAGVPTVVAYKVPRWEEAIARLLIRVPSVVLANLVLEETVVPEFLQNDCNAGALASALGTLLSDSPERARQLAAFSRLDHIMEIGSVPPSEKAAEIVLSLLRPKTLASSVAAKSPASS